MKDNLCEVRRKHEDMIDHRSYVHNLMKFMTQGLRKLRLENSGLNRIRTHDLCDTGRWELVTLWVRNVPVDGEEYKWIYERSYIWTAE